MMQLAPDDGYTALSPGSVQACPQYIPRTDMAREDERKLKKMRYGLDSNRRWIKEEDLFPVQSSVLDEEALFSDVVKEYCIVDPVSCRFFSRGDADIYRVITQGRNYYFPDSTSPNQSKKSIFIKAPLLMYNWAI